ncbi:MAG: hypothetical protein HOK89_08770 [Rhodospirillaceae bacterium]|nr:hypothetical protein [Rhodospirillaceae bacterium]|tara:strand:- start:733 stop:1296 length:564 start_codon:yes stop_codon:yes gene_type:complete
MTPLQVSMKFWEGIEKKNISLITIYSYSNIGLSIEDINQLLDFSVITFGKIIINKDIAEIETQMTITSDEKDINIPFKTHLHRKSDVWKVNYDESIRSLKTNQGMTELLRSIKKLTEGLADEIDVSIEDIKMKTMPVIESELENIEQRLRKKIPEFKNMLDELLDTIKNSLEKVIPSKKEEIKTQQT